MDKFYEACDNSWLTISIKKAEVMYQPTPRTPFHEPTITVKGQKLQAVEQVTYLGSTLSRGVNIDAEVNNISKS